MILCLLRRQLIRNKDGVYIRKMVPAFYKVGVILYVPSQCWLMTLNANKYTSFFITIHIHWRKTHWGILKSNTPRVDLYSFTRILSTGPHLWRTLCVTARQKDHSSASGFVSIYEKRLVEMELSTFISNRKFPAYILFSMRSFYITTRAASFIGAKRRVGRISEKRINNLYE